MIPSTSPETLAIRSHLDCSSGRWRFVVAHRDQASTTSTHAAEALCKGPLDVRFAVKMGKGVIAEEHDVEGGRPHGQRPEVGDQRDERQAPPFRFSSGPGDSAHGEIRAGDTKASSE